MKLKTVGNLIKFLKEKKSLPVGTFVECTRKFTIEDTKKFAELTGDSNPIHTDYDAAIAMDHPAPLVHGLLASSIFPAFFGANLPGSLYVSQTLKFNAPIYVDETVRIRLELKSQKRNLIECTSVVYKDNEVVEAITGVSRVWIPHFP